MRDERLRWRWQHRAQATLLRSVRGGPRPQAGRPASQLDDGRRVPYIYRAVKVNESITDKSCTAQVFVVAGNAHSSRRLKRDSHTEHRDSSACTIALPRPVMFYWMGGVAMDSGKCRPEMISAHPANAGQGCCHAH